MGRLQRRIERAERRRQRVGEPVVQRIWMFGADGKYRDGFGNLIPDDEPPDDNTLVVCLEVVGKGNAPGQP